MLYKGTLFQFCCGELLNKIDIHHCEDTKEDQIARRASARQFNSAGISLGPNIRKNTSFSILADSETEFFPLSETLFQSAIEFLRFRSLKSLFVNAIEAWYFTYNLLYPNHTLVIPIRFHFGNVTKPLCGEILTP